ncbi:MAG: SUMF1/EgtB/PvdO family nonheme iron enzyme [Myxococcota bacterium]
MRLRVSPRPSFLGRSVPVLGSAIGVGALVLLLSGAWTVPSGAEEDANPVTAAPGPPNREGRPLRAPATGIAPAGPRRIATRGPSRRTLLVLRAPGPRRVLIRGGTFTMGATIPAVATAQTMCRAEPLGRACTATLHADELVPHPVRLRDFWLDRTEVTVAAYARCVEVGVCRAPPHEAARKWTARPEHPMTLVSWYDAQRYCGFRGGRLPTEAEWERAARGWSDRVFPWGDVFNPRLANHGRFSTVALDAGDGFAELAPVGAYRAGRTPEGIYDLAGNVEEWVADWYAPGYDDGEVTNPTGPAVGDLRVIRGGSYRDGRSWLRTTARAKALPSTRRAHRGFRCAWDRRRDRLPRIRFPLRPNGAGPNGAGPNGARRR